MALKGHFPIRNHFKLSTGSGDYTVVSSRPTVAYSVQAFNNSSATIAYLKVYDAAAISSVQSTAGTPYWVGLIPVGALVPSTAANAQVAAGAGLSASWPDGLNFNNGLSYALVTGSSNNSTVAVAAESCIINIAYEGSSER